MDFRQYSHKDIGTLGERLAAEYLRRAGFIISDINSARKTGEIDVIASRKGILHFVEVKTVLCQEFPSEKVSGGYDPGFNLHSAKIKKVARTAEWYVANKQWKGEYQIDGALIWLRERDGLALIRYYPQIL